MTLNFLFLIFYSEILNRNQVKLKISKKFKMSINRSKELKCFENYNMLQNINIVIY